MGPAVPVEAGGQTIYVCCEGCVAAVRRAPDKYRERVIRDLASKPAIPRNAESRDRFAPSARAQRLCPVTGEELGSMGRPIPVNVRGRTIYVCCEPCVNAVRRDPEKYLRKVDGEQP
jgi:YHS domain-containing protein